MWENIITARLTASARVRGGRDVNIRRQVDSAGPAQPRRAGGRHDRGQRANPARVVRGDGLGDHPAHRDADQVHVGVTERVQQADRVARHVAEVVLVATTERGHRVRRPVIHVARSAGVAVVEPGHSIVAAGQRGDEIIWP